MNIIIGRMFAVGIGLVGIMIATAYFHSVRKDGLSVENVAFGMFVVFCVFSFAIVAWHLWHHPLALLR